MELRVKRFCELTTEELYHILKLRVDVFVVEQNCPYAELDDLDQNAIHVWLEDGGSIAAYLRVMDRGAESEYVSLGRLIAAKRRCGLGTRILQEYGSHTRNSARTPSTLKRRLTPRGYMKSRAFKQSPKSF